MKKILVAVAAVSLSAALVIPALAFGQAGPIGAEGALAANSPAPSQAAASSLSCDGVSGTVIGCVNAGYQAIDERMAALAAEEERAAAEAEAAAAAEAATAPYFVDADGDGICDNYATGSYGGGYGAGNGAGAGVGCPGYVDGNGDGVCDNYAQGICYGTHHGNGAGAGNGGGWGYTDANGDGVCDNYADRGNGRGYGAHGGGHGAHHRW